VPKNSVSSIIKDAKLINQANYNQFSELSKEVEKIPLNNNLQQNNT
jgi:hypothetical protein